MNLRVTFLAATLLALPAAAFADPVNGFYIGTGLGVSFYQDGGVDGLQFPAYGQVGPGAGRSSSGHSQNVIFTSGSFGYGFGNGFRLELQGDWRLSRLTIAASYPTSGNEEQYGAFVNGLYDFNINFGFPGLTPYVGAGFGYEQVHLANVSALGYVATPGLVLNSNGTDGGPAAQAILGLAYQVRSVPGLALTGEYRYTQIIGSLSFSGSGSAPGGIHGPATFGISENFNHTLLFGVRYTFGQAPRPVVQPIAQVVAPPVQPATRSYLVFFDWDRAELTDRARQIVGDAARGSTHTQTTRIQVNGYTDTSGSPHYNQGLSLRRAQAVAAELVRDGVPAPEISIQGFGETHLLVATGPGVREPQNRRVEIVLQ
jgi:OOP family OmpA-OmpF porin